MRSAIPLLTLATLLLAATAPAGVIHVPGEELTIAAGLGAASPGDTVLVECGGYYENGLVLPAGVTLMPEPHHPDCVSIDGGGSDVILTCDGITGAAVVGIEFKNGSHDTGGAVYCRNASVVFDSCRFHGNDASVSGGAMYWSEGTPQITGCTFNDNDAVSVGGALSIYVTDGSVAGCTFSDNQADWGGAVFANQPATTTVFTGCAFTTNVAVGLTQGGGAVWCGEFAAPTFTACHFEQNEGRYGGAANSTATSAPSFVDCEFNDNSSVYHGGAFHGYNDGTEFDGCEFTYNTAEGGGAGGALFNRSNAVLTGCTFFTNDASWGGAIGAHGDATLEIASCTFAENDVPRYSGGAGLYLHDGASATIDRTVIAFNTGGEAIKCDEASATLTCSDVFGNDLGDWVDCIAGQEASDGNLDVDPLFCDLLAYDLTLCADSECLPSFNDCGELIGAWPEGCPACGQPVESASWGVIKKAYR